MKTFYTGPTDMQKSVAHPTKKNKSVAHPKRFASPSTSTWDMKRIRHISLSIAPNFRIIVDPSKTPTSCGRPSRSTFPWCGAIREGGIDEKPKTTSQLEPAFFSELTKFARWVTDYSVSIYDPCKMCQINACERAANQSRLGETRLCSNCTNRFDIMYTDGRGYT